jgi:hypothetical protein
MQSGNGTWRTGPLGVTYPGFLHQLRRGVAPLGSQHQLSSQTGQAPARLSVRQLKIFGTPIGPKNMKIIPKRKGDMVVAIERHPKIHVWV